MSVLGCYDNLLLIKNRAPQSAASSKFLLLGRKSSDDVADSRLVNCVSK